MENPKFLSFLERGGVENSPQKKECSSRTLSFDPKNIAVISYKLYAAMMFMPRISISIITICA